MSFYPAFICMNGHVIATVSSRCPDRYCIKCGSPIIHKCNNCDATIRGSSTDDYIYETIYSVPAYCPTCGKPYPWTSAAIEATTHLIAEESRLSEQDQQKLIEVLPDALSDTPRTQLAAMRFKRIMALGGFIADGLRDFAVNCCSQAFLKFLGLD